MLLLINRYVLPIGIQMIREQKMSEGNSQVISCKELYALVCHAFLEEAESPLILMHDSPGA